MLRVDDSPRSVGRRIVIRRELEVKVAASQRAKSPIASSNTLYTTLPRSGWVTAFNALILPLGAHPRPLGSIAVPAGQIGRTAVPGGCWSL